MNKRGIVLIICYMVIVILSILGAAFLVRSVSERNVASGYYSSTQALWVAEAGIQQALWELKYNSCADCSNCSGNRCISGTLTSAGDYDVTITATTITSQGSVPSRNAANPVTRTVQATISSSPPFNYAVFARNKIILLNNAMTDSYNSSLGLYGGSNISANGNVGTNSGAANDVSLGNNATVNGNASTGPGGTVQLSNNAEVTGSITHANNTTIPSVTIPSSLSSLPNAGAINISNGGSQAIPSGSYNYSSISMANNATLTINGTVNLYLSSTSSAISMGNNCNIVVSAGAKLTVYVKGALSIANNSSLNNVSKIPANFQLYSSYSGSNGVQISNNGNFYGSVYAPDTDVILANNTDSFGSFVGKTVDLSNNSDIHYDQALNQVTNPIFPLTVGSWYERESNNNLQSPF